MEVQKTVLVSKTYSDKLNLDPSVNFRYSITSNGECNFTNNDVQWQNMDLATVTQIKNFFEQMHYILDMVSQNKTPRFRRNINTQYQINQAEELISSEQ